MRTALPDYASINSVRLDGEYRRLGIVTVVRSGGEFRAVGRPSCERSGLSYALMRCLINSNYVQDGGKW